MTRTVRLRILRRRGGIRREEAVMEEVEAFAARAVAAIGEEDLAWVAEPDAIAALLGLAGDAAHGVVRPAAPIATFLAGIALARSGGGRAELDQALARIRASVPAD